MWRKIAAGLALLAGGLAAGSLLGKKRSRTISQVQTGDFIQWESQGTFVFPEPRRVSYVHDSDMGLWVFVEGSATGIPIDQVVVIKRA